MLAKHDKEIANLGFHIKVKGQHNARGRHRRGRDTDTLQQEVTGCQERWRFKMATAWC